MTTQLFTMRYRIKAAGFRSAAAAMASLVALAAVAMLTAAQGEGFHEVHRGKYFIWYVDDYVYSRWDTYREKLEPFFSYADACYEALYERLGVKPKTPLYIVVSKKFRGGAFAAGVIGEIGKGPGIGIADDAFLNVAFDIEQYWAYVLILHEMVNLFTGSVTHEWPRAWWADHRSPFPCMVVECVLRELGYEDVARVHFREHRYDALLVMFHRLRRDFGWEMFIRMFRKMVELGVDLAEYPQDPGASELSLEKANAVYYFLMYGAREDITEYLVEAGLPPPSPELIKKLEDKYGLGVYGAIYKPGEPTKFSEPCLTLVCGVTPPVDKVALVLKDGSRIELKVASEESMLTFLGVEACVMKLTVPLPALGKKLEVVRVELLHRNAGYRDPTAIIIRDLEGERYYRAWTHSYYHTGDYWADVLEELRPSPVVISTSTKEVTIAAASEEVAKVRCSFEEGCVVVAVEESVEVKFTIITNATVEGVNLAGGRLSVVVRSPGRAYVKVTVPDVLFKRFGLSERDVRAWINGVEVGGEVVREDMLGKVAHLVVEGRANVTLAFGRSLEVVVVDKLGRPQSVVIYLRYRGRLLNSTYAEGRARFVYVPLSGVEVEACRLDVTHAIMEPGAEGRVTVTLPTTKEEYVEENERLSTKYTALRSEYERLAEEHAELEREYARVRRDYVKALSELKRVREELEAIKAAYNETVRELEVARARIEPLHAAVYVAIAAAVSAALGFALGRRSARC